MSAPLPAGAAFSGEQVLCSPAQHAPVNVRVGQASATCRDLMRRPEKLMPRLAFPAPRTALTGGGRVGAIEAACAATSRTGAPPLNALTPVCEALAMGRPAARETRLLRCAPPRR